MGRLDGKVALIVGGGSGLGRAVVREFASEGANLGVLELSADKCEDLRQSEPDALVVQGDALTAAHNARAVDETIGRFGRLDAVACFVGIFDFYVPLEAIPDDRFDAAFDEAFAANVKTMCLAVRAGLPALKETRGCALLTVSTSGYFPGRGGSLYVASKFAVRGLVLQLAHELAPAVRVNGVAPGGTADTDMRGLASLGQGETRLGTQPGREDELRRRTPLEVTLRPEDHASCYTFLASPESKGITGEVIHSDGGIAARG